MIKTGMNPGLPGFGLLTARFYSVPTEADLSGKTDMSLDKAREAAHPQGEVQKGLSRLAGRERAQPRSKQSNPY